VRPFGVAELGVSLNKMDLIAISTAHYPTLLKALSLEENEFISIDDGDFWGEKLENGWIFLRATKSNYSLTSPNLARISANCEFYNAKFIGTTMFSLASYWNRGRNIWSIWHDPDRKWDHLGIEGSPPSQLSDIKKHLFAKQRTNGGKKSIVNYIFNIPIHLLGSILNYNFDDSTTNGDLVGYKPVEN
jgi:hypothetical protein